MARAVALICACALLLASAAPMPPTERRTPIKETKVTREKTIVVRPMQNAYFFPYSLLPLPKYPDRDDDSSETLHYRIRLRKNNR